VPNWRFANWTRCAADLPLTPLDSDGDGLMAVYFASVFVAVCVFVSVCVFGSMSVTMSVSVSVSIHILCHCPCLCLYAASHPLYLSLCVSRGWALRLLRRKLGSGW